MQSLLLLLLLWRRHFQRQGLGWRYCVGLGDEHFLAHATAHPALGLAQLLLCDKKGGGAARTVGGQVHCGFLKRWVESAAAGLQRRCHQYPALLGVGHFKLAVGGVGLL